MRKRIKIATTLIATALAGSVTVGAQPAQAAPEPEPARTLSASATRGIWPSPGGPRPAVVSDTDWVEAWTSLEAGACGTVIYGQKKNPDTATRERRSVTYSNGDVLTLVRGSVILTVRPEIGDAPSVPKGADVVVSGAVRRVDYTSGATYVERKAPGIVAVHTSENAPGPERDAFLKANLPGLAVLKTGVLTEYTAPGASITEIRRKPTTLINMCNALAIPDFQDSPVLVYESEGI